MDNLKAIINKPFYKSFDTTFIEKKKKNHKSVLLGHLLAFSFYISDESGVKTFLKIVY